MHTWVWVCVHRSQRTSGVLLDHALLYSLEARPLTEPEAGLVASETHQACPCRRSAGVTDAFCRSSVGLNSGFHACVENTLTCEPGPQPRAVFDDGTWTVV